MNVDDAVRDGVDSRFGNKLAKCGENAKVWFEFIDDWQQFGSLLDLANFDIVFFGLNGDRKRFAHVGVWQNEGADFNLRICK